MRARLLTLLAILWPLAAAADGRAFHLDPAVMSAALCEIDAHSLRPMPAKIGRVSLPSSVIAKLRMMGIARPSRLQGRLTRGTVHSKDGSKSLLRIKELWGGPSDQARFCAGMNPQYFVAGAGNGGLRSGIVAVAVAPLDVWRVHSDHPSYCGHAKAVGPWWSLTDPRTLHKSAYRKRNSICLSWNRFTHVTHCKLKPGTPVAIGPTESVTRNVCSCSADSRRKNGDGVDEAYVADDSYKADDSTLQVYVNTFASKGLAPLMTCDAPVVWQ
jgi:hypothetical protein